MTNQLITIPVPENFNYDECLNFIDRGYDDCMVYVANKTIYQAIDYNNKMVLIAIQFKNNQLIIQLVNENINKHTAAFLHNYVVEWFDLDRNIDSFLSMAKEDKILSPLISKYPGLRLIGINDLFETLSWAILGQQVNLTFAYKTKRALVERFGKSKTYDHRTYYLFPEASIIGNQSVATLREMQISNNKAKYLINLSNSFNNNEISKAYLKNLPSIKSKLNKLTSLYGIGQWTANYALMKCLKEPNAFPIGDAGLANAIKNQLRLSEKPDEDYLLHLASKWEGWQAYATLYLWRSLV